MEQTIKLPSYNIDNIDVDIDMNEVTAFLKQYGGNHASHLIFLQDKEFFWAQEHRVLIVYKKIADKLVVLGDPVGDENFIQAAVKEFHTYSEDKGLKPVFYQVSPTYMHYYHENGYRFLKLGEEGRVDLDRFSLTGKKGAKLRTSLNKFTRDFCTFRVMRPPYSDELLAELKHISSSWLGEQKEKGFSVSSFREEYVSRFPIALLFDGNGEILAFATLASDYKTSLTIDLMRRAAGCPAGTMDVLFIHIFNWAKDKGYQTCSLGMAPLSNVGTSKHAFLGEKLFRFAYLHGNTLYNFKGLKEYKSKFACTWEPKYLAYKKSFLPTTMVHLFLLINRQPQPEEKIKRKYLFKRTS